MPGRKIAALSILFLLTVPCAFAQDPGASPAPTPTAPPKIGQANDLINCQAYRAKRENVPVYAQADPASEVIYRLVLGERVCYIGEKDKFAIIDWRWQQQINDREAETSGGKQETAYVKIYDIWFDGTAANANAEDSWTQARRHLKGIGQGLVPEDIFGPFRPLIDFVHPPDKCRAGKEICDKIELQNSAVPTPTLPGAR